MRWSVTRPGANTAPHTTQINAAMNITVDPEPRQIVSGDGSSTRSTFAIRAVRDEIRMETIATQCLAATSTAEMISRNHTTTNSGASEKCARANGMPKNFQSQQDEEAGQHRIAPPFLPAPVSSDCIRVAHVIS